MLQWNKMTAKRFLLILPFCSMMALTHCKSREDDTSEQKFIGGVKATTGQFPATVNIYGTANTSSCGAGKIGARRFLTAAHCVDALFLKKDGKVIIEHGVQETKAKYFHASLTNVQKTNNNPNAYGSDGLDISRTYGLDVAVFDIDVESPNIGVATIHKEPMKVGDKLVISGYGCESDTQPPSSGYKDKFLKFGVNKILTVASNHYFMEKNNLQGFEARLCKGDSGTPAYLYRSSGTFTVIAGVNSLGANLETWSGVARIDTTNIYEKH